MDRRISINELIAVGPRKENFFEFYDWFCTDRGLKGRAEKLFPKLKFLVKMGILDGDNLYVWFKNRCPMMGHLYDDMRFSTFCEQEHYVGGIAPRQGYTNNNKCCVWFVDIEGYMKDMEFDTWSDFKARVKTDKEFREMLTKAYSVPKFGNVKN